MGTMASWLFGKKKTPAGAAGRGGAAARTACRPAPLPALPPPAHCPAPSQPPHLVAAARHNHINAELLRENKRMLDRAIRELDRERMGLQNQVWVERGAACDGGLKVSA